MSCIIKFICADLGTQPLKDDIVMGSHTDDIIEKALNKFIARYVLCPKCKYPELNYEIDATKKKKPKLFGFC